MKNMKTGLHFLLKGTVMIAFLAFGLVSCDQEELNLNNAENVQTANLSGNKGKIDICHYSADNDQWFVASVNPKSWAEHSLHGDVRLDDQDGDGYVPDNKCEYGQMGDCDDTDPAVNPGATEIPYNGIDDDCNSTTPDDDLDGDGYNHDIDCDDTTYSEDNTCCLTNETIRTAVSLWLLDQEAAIATYGHISIWCTSNVTDMSWLFNGASSFNEYIGAWDVSSVTNMSGMFSEASEFNQDISKWIVNNVTDMSFMFGKASVFNQDISEWVVSNVKDMSYMFNEAYNFNQDLSGWDVSQVDSCSNFSKQTDSWTYPKPNFVICTP